MKTRHITIITVIVSLAACSSAPERNVALNKAETQFKTAQRNLQVTTLAAEELTQAREALRLAQDAWEKKQDPAKVNHFAYLASQRITIAQDTASSLSAQEITANASAERDKLLLMVRTNEADRANERATRSEQQGRDSAAALAAAKTDAAESAQQRQARINELETALKDLNAKQTERGMVVTLGDVLFNTGKAEISSGAAPDISKLADFLNRYPLQRVSIEGFTDSTGTASGNYALSQRRADAVQDALINLRVQRNQLSTRAYGQDNPIADNSTAVGRQLNRRVEIVFAQTTDKVTIRE